ncbi:unnamed protein product, partial [Choristocarpus tenellus]
MGLMDEVGLVPTPRKVSDVNCSLKDAHPSSNLCASEVPTGLNPVDNVLWAPMSVGLTEQAVVSPTSNQDENVAMANHLPTSTPVADSTVPRISCTAAAKKAHRQEVLELRARGKELDTRLKTAKSDLEVTRHRQEFLLEEADQARVYGAKLAREMKRVSCIKEALSKDQQAALGELCRHLEAMQKIEHAEALTHQQNKSLEIALREDIEELNLNLTGSTTHDKFSRKVGEG